MIKKNLLIFILFFSFSISSQNLTTFGPYIKDDNSNNIILRGINLGGWMLQEPYMFEFTGAADSQHEFKEKLVDFIGQENTDNFYNSWLENFITKADIDSLASYGYNSVRLPMHYNLFTLPIQQEPNVGENTWIETGFNLVDNLLEWCEENNMYLILDLHAAPGGQGFGSDINDYDPNLPSLWESEENKNKTSALWGQIANRYKDEPWIGGYDLLNETHWDLGENELRDFYIDVTNEIRIYDDNHIIFIEGNGYANDFSGLTPPWDDNMVYSFHKYWSYNDSLDWVTWMRNEYGTPLWMGEAGENSNQWFTEAIKVFEENYIGWAFWPWKKIESISAPYAISSNSNYESLVNYFRGEGNPPTIDNAVQGLMQLASDANIANASFQKDVVDAMIRQPNSNQTIPFNQIPNIPGLFYASDYDLGTNGFAYNDSDFATYHVNTNSFQAWNQGWQYRNDGVDIENSEDPESNGFQVGFTDNDEWLQFTVNVLDSGFYNIVSRYASTSSGLLNLSMDGFPITGNIILYNTGSYSNFVNKLTSGIYLSEGIHKIKIRMVTGGYNVTRFNFDLMDETPEFSIQYAETQGDESSITLLLSHPMVSNQDLDISHFEVFVNSESVMISNIEIDDENTQLISISLEEEFTFLDQISVSFNQENYIQSTFNNYLSIFSDFPVFNNLPERILIPGLIQAEDYSYQEGFTVSETSDTNGGYKLGYTDSGDYAEYPVLITETGDYDVSVRIASESSSGSIILHLIDGSNEEYLTQITLPVTGGWETWETVSTSLNLEQGAYKLRLTVNQSGFDINWIDFDFTGDPMSLNEMNRVNFNLYPNPTSNFISINTDLSEFKIEIFDLLGKKVHFSQNKSQINLSHLDSGIYLLTMESKFYSTSKVIIKK
ncbi:MAG: carbohydrate-binding protein [Flavobacteriaceae bacterium]|nr:carbohydrate-binding protein [Flavobacteriaceae bacterium]